MVNSNFCLKTAF